MAQPNPSLKSVSISTPDRRNVLTSYNHDAFKTKDPGKFTSLPLTDDFKLFNNLPPLIQPNVVLPSARGFKISFRRILIIVLESFADLLASYTKYGIAHAWQKIWRNDPRECCDYSLRRCRRIRPSFSRHAPASQQ